MDFEKLLKQREAKETPAPSKASKRQPWKVATFYMRPETKARLERVLLERKLSGGTGAVDQSEAIEEALQIWLKREEGKQSKG